MKAAQLTRYGGQDTVTINRAADQPGIGPDQVLVEVYAAGVNPFDLTVRDGRARQMAELHLPATLGGDVAGTVAAVGKNVSGFQIGQTVYGQANALSGQGSFAEFTPVAPTQLADKPVKTDWLEAAALPLVGSSAYQALIDHMDLQTGQKILIHGGAGGIGSVAIQLAKYLGADVATTVSVADVDYVKSLGADRIIDYKTQDFAQLINDYDAVYDTIGGDTNRRSYHILKPGGHLVSMLEQPDAALVKELKINYTAQFTRVTKERLSKLAELVDHGVIKLPIDRIFPLDRAAAALEYLKTQHTRGKVVIKIKD